MHTEPLTLLIEQRRGGFPPLTSRTRVNGQVHPYVLGPCSNSLSFPLSILFLPCTIYLYPLPPPLLPSSPTTITSSSSFSCRLLAVADREDEDEDGRKEEGESSGRINGGGREAERVGLERHVPGLPPQSCFRQSRPHHQTRPLQQ